MKSRFFWNQLLLALCTVSPVAASDDLFSEIAMESVFEKKGAPAVLGASQGGGEALERITGVSSLAQALKYAGYTPKEVSGRVAIQVPHAGWNFPTELQVQIESDRISIEMALVAVTDTKGVAPNELLKLLELNDAVSGHFFAFEPSRKLLVLRSSIENRALSSKKIQNHLNQVAAFGEKYASLWSQWKVKSADELKRDRAAGGANQSTSALSTSNPNFSLIGNWGAALSEKDSIAIQIKGDSTFKLVTVQSGQAKISNGKWNREGGRLSLVGDDGVTLQCTVIQTASNAFQLLVHDEKGNAKLKVDFQKSAS